MDRRPPPQWLAVPGLAHDIQMVAAVVPLPIRRCLPCSDAHRNSTRVSALFMGITTRAVGMMRGLFQELEFRLDGGRILGVVGSTRP